MASIIDSPASGRHRREPLRAQPNRRKVLVTVRRSIRNADGTPSRSLAANPDHDAYGATNVEATAGEAGRLNQRPMAHDGVRALAAIAAFLYLEGHLPGGFVGIDLFLAVAGFTLTSVVIDRHEIRLGDLVKSASDRASAAAGPAVVLLACAALYGAYVATTPELSRLHSEAVAAVFLVSNWHAVFDANVLSGPALAPSFLGHLWALALVAQIAVIWMLFVAVLAGNPEGRPRRLTVAALSLAALSSIAAYYFGSTQGDPARAFFGTDGHATSFLLGAAVASWSLSGPSELSPADDGRGARHLRRTIRRSAPPVATASALGFLAWQSTGLHAADPATYSLPLIGVAVASAIVVWGTARATSGVSRLLSWRSLTFVGTTAYCAYLFYLPVVAVVNTETTMFDGWRLSLLRGAILIAGGRIVRFLFSEIASATTRSGSARVHTGQPITPLTVGMVALIVVLGLVTARSPESAAGGPANRVLVVGDQMAGDVADGLALSTGGHFSIFDRSIDGCGIFSPSRTRVGEVTYNVLPECQRWVDTWAAAVLEVQPHVVVLSAGEWDATVQELAGQWIEPCEPPYQAHYAQVLGSAVDILSAHGASVVLITARDRDRSDTSWAGCVNDLYRSFVSSNHDRVSLVDIGGFLCENGSCSRTIGGRSIVTENGIDLNDHGKELVARWLEPRLAQAAKS